MRCSPRGRRVPTATAELLACHARSPSAPTASVSRQRRVLRLSPEPKMPQRSVGTIDRGGSSVLGFRFSNEDSAWVSRDDLDQAMKPRPWLVAVIVAIGLFAVPAPAMAGSQAGPPRSPLLRPLSDGPIPVPLVRVGDGRYAMYGTATSARVSVYDSKSPKDGFAVPLPEGCSWIAATRLTLLMGCTDPDSGSPRLFRLNSRTEFRLPRYDMSGTPQQERPVFTAIGRHWVRGFALRESGRSYALYVNWRTGDQVSETSLTEPDYERDLDSASLGPEPRSPVINEDPYYTQDSRLRSRAIYLRVRGKRMLLSSCRRQCGEARLAHGLVTWTEGPRDNTVVAYAPVGSRRFRWKFASRPDGAAVLVDNTVRDVFFTVRDPSRASGRLFVARWQ
jgi:hypothetical protein